MANLILDGVLSHREHIIYLSPLKTGVSTPGIARIRQILECVGYEYADYSEVRIVSHQRVIYVSLCHDSPFKSD
jgi:hypothetical protein